MDPHIDPNVAPLALGGFQGQDAAMISYFGGQGVHPTHTFDMDLGFSFCREERYYDPIVDCEIVRVQVLDRNTVYPTDIYHIVNFPVDKVTPDLAALAITLPELRAIIFRDPSSWGVFSNNYDFIMTMTRFILYNAPFITTVTLYFDMLLDRRLIFFDALNSLPRLREVEILPPFSLEGLVDNGEVLNEGILQLTQLEHLKIPLVLITSEFLICLGRLPALRFLKIINSTQVPFPGLLLIKCLNRLPNQNPEFFGRLEVLDVRDNPHRLEDFTSKDTLHKIFPNTRFIKT